MNRSSFLLRPNGFMLSQLILIFLLAGCQSTRFDKVDAQAADSNNIFVIPSNIKSRAASFENMTGAKGQGGQAASSLGVGRKGSPAKQIAPGEVVELANIAGSGTIRHIWMTLPKDPKHFRSLVIRAYWDDQDYPSIEVPIGDFFGFAHAYTPAFQSAVHSVGEEYALNFWLPMPFTRNAKVTLTNELDKSILVFYQIDYTLGDRHSEDVGRMHTLFKRSNPTTIKNDFELLPKREGRGRFIGSVIGIRTLETAQKQALDWWGEGEVKMYIDGDDTFPTITGTGAEDYVGLSYGIQQTAYQYHGANFVGEDNAGENYISMYRLHLPDPVYWQDDIRVTLQQIGCCKEPIVSLEAVTMDWYMNALYERRDDYSAATFWYEPIPSSPLPLFPDLSERTADLPSFSND